MATSRVSLASNIMGKAPCTTILTIGPHRRENLKRLGVNVRRSESA